MGIQIEWPPEMAAEMAKLPKAPKWGTPEHQAWVEDLRKRAWKGGLRRFSGDEVLIAMERERAGYDGLGELWGCVPAPTLTQT
jgi:hypothetical protein